MGQKNDLKKVFSFVEELIQTTQNTFDTFTNHLANLNAEEESLYFKRIGEVYKGNVDQQIQDQFKDSFENNTLIYEGYVITKEDLLPYLDDHDNDPVTSCIYNMNLEFLTLKREDLLQIVYYATHDTSESRASNFPLKYEFIAFEINQEKIKDREKCIESLYNSLKDGGFIPINTRRHDFQQLFSGRAVYNEVKIFWLEKAPGLLVLFERLQNTGITVKLDDQLYYQTLETVFYKPDGSDFKGTLSKAQSRRGGQEKNSRRQNDIEKVVERALK